MRQDATPRYPGRRASGRPHPNPVRDILFVSLEREHRSC